MLFTVREAFAHMIMRTDIEARGAVKRKEIRLVPENSIMSVLASVGELQSTYGRCVVAKKQSDRSRGTCDRTLGSKEYEGMLSGFS